MTPPAPTVRPEVISLSPWNTHEAPEAKDTLPKPLAPSITPVAPPRSSSVPPPPTTAPMKVEPPSAMSTSPLPVKATVWSAATPVRWFPS